MRKVKWQDKSSKALYAWKIKWKGQEATAIIKNRQGEVVKAFIAKCDDTNDINDVWSILFNKVYDYVGFLIGRNPGCSEIYTYNPFILKDANTVF